MIIIMMIFLMLLWKDIPQRPQKENKLYIFAKKDICILVNCG